MADTIIDNINSIIRTKSELKSVLTENGQNPSDTFSEYPDMFRSAIASATGADEETINSYISAYLGAYNFIDQNALSANSYITLQDIPSVDLSSYVTYDFLSAQSYTTTSDVDLSIENATTIEEDVGESETITVSLKDVLEESGIISQTTDGYDVKDIAIVAEDVVNGILGVASYVTSGEISQMGYITANDVDMSGYLPITGGTLSGNLVPSQSASYNLGSSSSRWKEIRSKSIYADTAYLQDTSYSSDIVPKENNTYTLGDSSHLYAATYSSQLNVGNNSKVYNDSGGITFSINSNNGIRIGASAIYPKTSGAFNNGSSSNYWKSTYTSNIYADNAYISNIHNFIWTGTSAEYAALSDYTTYQIYMIKES